MNFALASRISFLHRKSASPKLLILVQAQNRDRAATDSAAMQDPLPEHERGNGSELRRYFLIKTALGDAEETKAGRLFHTDAKTVRKLYDDVVQRLEAEPPLIGSIDELLRIEYAEPTQSNGEPFWVVCWDARDPYCKKKLPGIPDGTNLYFAVAERE